MAHTKFDKTKSLSSQAPWASVFVKGLIANLQDEFNSSEQYMDGDAGFWFTRCPLDDWTVNERRCVYLDGKCKPLSDECWLKILTDNIKHDMEEYPFDGCKTYQEYLTSYHWQETRLKALAHYNNHCNLCGSQEALNVHHNNYDRLGFEEMADLTVLCRDCHAKFHDKAVR